jgi:hypothetical protein
MKTYAEQQLQYPCSCAAAGVAFPGCPLCRGTGVRKESVPYDHQRSIDILRLIARPAPRRVFQFACRHEVYFEEMVRIDDDLVVAACHKCHSLLAAGCGLNLGARLMGSRPKPCLTCKGSGVAP